MTADRLLLGKALRLLDRGFGERGEAVLRETIAVGRGATLVTALCCLGEVLLRQDRRAEAAEVLRRCLTVQLGDDECDHELATAGRLLVVAEQ